MMMMTKQRSTVWILVFAVCMVIGSASCGPMNPPPSAGSSSQAAVADPAGTMKTSTGTMKVSQSERFLVLYSVTGGDDRSTKPALGDNKYSLRVVHVPELSPCSPDTTVTAHYEMPQMPEMGKSEEVAARQADGSYQATLFYSMPGLWKITIRVNEPGMQDSFSFEVSI